MILGLLVMNDLFPLHRWWLSALLESRGY